MKNGQSRDTVNIYRRHRTMTNKTENTTQHKEKIKWMNKMDPTEIQG